MVSLRFLMGVGIIWVAGLVGCSSDSGDACGGQESWVRIVSPVEGQQLSASDDTMPGGVIDFDVVVEHCGLAPEQQVAIFLLAPVESAYGFRMAEEDRLVYSVPFIPGEQSMRAEVTDTAIRSDIRTFSVTP